MGDWLFGIVSIFVDDVAAAYNILSLFGLSISLVASIAVLYYLLSYDKRAAIEAELGEAKRMMELEQARYSEMEQRSEELAKIRHDFNNQLASIVQLVHTGEDNAARDMIHALSLEIAETKENPYCDIPAVNAILSEKAQACAASGIGLEVGLDFPDHLSVEPMHLCSVFGNLLDDAIDACRRTKGSDTPIIQLNSMVDGDYLFIKIVNPSGKSVKTPVRGRGYGSSRILSDLACRYGGGYQSEHKDGVFTAVVSLLAVDADTQAAAAPRSLK